MKFLLIVAFFVFGPTCWNWMLGVPDIHCSLKRISSNPNKAKEEAEIKVSMSTVAGIEKHIQKLTHRKKKEYAQYAYSISKYSKKYHVDPQVVVGVLMTESTFNQDAVSYTGDLGIGQINPRVWKKEFARLNRRPLDIEKLQSNPDYAIERTVEILAMMKDPNDPHWFGKYHSKTPDLKRSYASRVQSRMKTRSIASNP